MLHTPTRIESTTVLAPDREYPVDWTGPVSGTVVVAGVTPPPVVPAAVSLDRASAAAASVSAFHGAVTGRITLRPEPNRWIVQAYRQVDGRRREIPIQAMVRPDGTFRLDLSAIQPGPGNWQFGVLDSLAGYAAVGVPWPSAGTYSGWEIRTFATTDRRYLIGTQPASADGNFTFDASAPGRKTFQLVDLGTGADSSRERILAEHAPPTGLVRSFGPQPVGGFDADAVSVLSYSYDQALALQTALVMDDPVTARTLAQGLMALQTTSGAQAGGFLSSAPQSNPAGGEPIYRTGNTAMSVYSLLSYLRAGYGSHGERLAVESAAELGVDWLLRQQLPSGPMAGLLTGGWGQVGSTTVDPSERLLFASTEHNLDAWHALSLAVGVLGCHQCVTAEESLRASIMNVLLDPGGAGFSQGMRPEGRDTVDPLDVNSWGAIFLDATGQSGLAGAVLDHTAAFQIEDASISGYLAFRPQPAIPDPARAVWFEGSFGVALASARHGDVTLYRDTMTALGVAQRSDGSFPVATTEDTDRGFSTASGVAPTTWFILANRPDHPFSLWSAAQPG